MVFNSGRSLENIYEYIDYFDGYLMENFMGDQLKSTFTQGLETADSGYTVIYAVDTDDTGEVNLTKMRLGLTLSLLYNNTYFAYDFDPRDHGQAWWYPEYDVTLGAPLGECYEKYGAFWREVDGGIVVTAPLGVQVHFVEYINVSTNATSQNFTVEPGDGRIYRVPD